MKNSLKDYLNNRMGHTEKPVIRQNPVITIARDSGCPSKVIGQIIADYFNWELISKETIINSAKSLNIDPVKMEEVMKGKQQDFTTSFIDSFNKDLKNSDLKIKHTIEDILRYYISRGNCVIIGRGGNTIATGHPKSIRVKLEAPLNWRIKQYIIHDGYSKEKAIRIINENDTQRERFRKIFNNNKDLTNTDFDIIFNCENLTNNQIANTLIELVKSF